MKNLVFLFFFLPLCLAAQQSACPGTITNGANNNCNGNSNCSDILVLNFNLDTLQSAITGDSVIRCNTPGNSGVNCNPLEMESSNYYLYTKVANKTTTSCLYNGGGEFIGVLFVSLTDFYATRSTFDNSIEITWVTEAEKDNDYFTLERSFDGVNWEVITEIDGAGNSDKELIYSYTDTDNVKGKTVYYRLSQTDFDGSSHRFGIITSKTEVEKVEVSTVNLLGQPVDEFYQGIVIVTYNDGTTVKKYQN